nr:coniferyl aldehyde dehydrogenase [uncultured Sphingomonas sp.]
MTKLEKIAAQTDMQEILRVQKVAFLADGPPSLAQRKANLARLKKAVFQYRGQLQQAISEDFGHRSHHETDIMEIMVVVEAIDYLSGNLRRFMRTERRDVGMFFQAGSARVEYQPKGVIGVMAPWNYPVSLVLIPLATAIAAGNRAMIKPSELTPRTSDVLAEMLHGTFAPDQVCVILGGPEVGAEFSGLAFDHLLFTGSTPVGKLVMKAAAENLVPVTLELGGKSPAIVAPGQVTRDHVASIVFGKLSNAGQTCVAPDYALVHEDELDRFVDLFDRETRRSYPDGPTGKDYSSIINARHFDRLTALANGARDAGTKVLEVGVDPERVSERVRTMAPTLIINPADESDVMVEEIFGPILPVRTYRALDEAIAFINARPRPLALYFFGQSGPDMTKVLTQTTSGNVGINNTLLHVAQDDLPFGGVGASGMGAYHGIEGFRSMSHAKGIFTQRRWNLPKLLRPPFGKLADRAMRFVLG